MKMATLQTLIEDTDSFKCFTFSNWKDFGYLYKSYWVSDKYRMVIRLDSCSEGVIKRSLLTVIEKNAIELGRPLVEVPIDDVLENWERCGHTGDKITARALSAKYNEEA